MNIGFEQRIFHNKTGLATIVVICYCLILSDNTYNLYKKRHHKHYLETNNINVVENFSLFFFTKKFIIYEDKKGVVKDLTKMHYDFSHLSVKSSD
jgi:hypothetical protein